MPDLADDVFLHCLVEQVLTWESDIGTHKKSLDCFYIIDYGVGLWVDVTGEPLGYYRYFDCGRVVYAPTVGPVYMYEIGLVEPGDPPTHGIRYAELEIIGQGAGALPLTLR